LDSENVVVVDSPALLMSKSIGKPPWLAWSVTAAGADYRAMVQLYLVSSRPRTPLPIRFRVRGER